MFGGFVKSFSAGRRGITAPAVETLPDLTGTTDVAWTDDTYFSFWTAQTSTTTDIMAGNQLQTYVLCYAHREIRLLADSISRAGVGTYSTQTSGPKPHRMIIANAPNSLRFPQTNTGIASYSSTSSSGAFVQGALDTAQTIPANTYFLVGIRQIAFAATRALANSRSATQGGNRVFTVFPTIYRMSAQTEFRTPVQFGGFAVPFDITTGYVPVLSYRFKQSDHQGGAVTVTTESPFVGGGNSYLFSSSIESYIQRNASANWALGTGDFTIEWFSRQSDTSQFQRVFSVGNFSAPYNPIRIGVSIESDTFYFWRNGAATSYGSAGNLNTWIHWAIVRISGVTRIYKNGVQFGTNLTDTTNYSVSTIDLYIGNTNTPATNSAFVGEITNFRWIKGLGVYTGAFTPPTSALTAESGENPYGGSNTAAIGAGFTKLLLVP